MTIAPPGGSGSCSGRDSFFAGAADFPALEVFAPLDDVRPGDDAEFLGPDDAGEAHEIRDGVPVDSFRAGVIQIAKPLELRRHRQRAAAAVERWLLAEVERERGTEAPAGERATYNLSPRSPGGTTNAPERLAA